MIWIITIMIMNVMLSFGQSLQSCQNLTFTAFSQARHWRNFTCYKTRFREAIQNQNTPKGRERRSQSGSKGRKLVVGAQRVDRLPLAT